MRIIVPVLLTAVAAWLGLPSWSRGEFKRNHVLNSTATAPAAVDATAPPPAPPLETTIVTRFSQSKSFEIHFSFDPKIARGYDVFLYVSVDRGKVWRWYGRQNAADQKFQFRAARDGEYEFAILTVPAGTQPAPGVTLQSQLRYVVDSQPPKINLQIAESDQHEIAVDWQVSDANVNPAALWLEFQTAPDAEWQPLTLDRPRKLATQTAISGQHTWRLETPANRGRVRLTTRDLADNIGQSIQPLTPAGEVAAATDANPETASMVANSADRPPTREATAEIDSATSISAAALPPSTPPAEIAPESTAESKPPAAEAIAWPADDASPEVPGGGANSRLAAKTVEPAASPAAPVTAGHSAASRAISEFASSRSSQVESPAELAAPPAPLTDAPAGMPVGETPRMTRSLRFHLEYSIDAVGPSGVEKVELWVTRDQSRTWQRLSIDEDRESPVLVELTADGLYGFRVVIVAKNGLASPTPRPGDPAELWVGADRAEPQAEITAAAYGSGARSGHLDIRWQATDEFLGPRPISLLISEHREGPWSPIAAGLPNTGQYFWRADPRVPDQFFLRLEVRDEAGNRTAVQLRQPIASAGLIPKGRIQGISPLGE